MKLAKPAPNAAKKSLSLRSASKNRLQSRFWKAKTLVRKRRLRQFGHFYKQQIKGSPTPCKRILWVSANLRRKRATDESHGVSSGDDFFINQTSCVAQFTLIRLWKHCILRKMFARTTLVHYPNGFLRRAEYLQINRTKCSNYMGKDCILSTPKLNNISDVIRSFRGQYMSWSLGKRTPL